MKKRASHLLMHYSVSPEPPLVKKSILVGVACTVLGLGKRDFLDPSPHFKINEMGKGAKNPLVLLYPISHLYLELFFVLKRPLQFTPVPQISTCCNSNC